MRSLITLGGVCVAALLLVAPAAATPPVPPRARARSPLARPTTRLCSRQLGSTLYMNAEPEMRSAINPTNANNIVGAYQQDRWDDGGARGLVSSWSNDGGATWHPVGASGRQQVLGRELRSRLRPLGLVRAERRPLLDLALVRLLRHPQRDHRQQVDERRAELGPGARDHGRRHERPRQAVDHGRPVQREPGVRRLGPLPVAAGGSTRATRAGSMRRRTSSRRGSPARRTADRRGSPPGSPTTRAPMRGRSGTSSSSCRTRRTTFWTGWSCSPTTRRSFAAPQVAVIRSTDHGSTWSRQATIIAPTRSVVLRRRSIPTTAMRSAAATCRTSRSTRTTATSTRPGTTTA